MNHIVLKGRLTKDPELRMTQSEKSVCSFTVAVDRGFGDKKTADFINCIAWNKTAEFVDKYFTKGQEILLNGSLQIRSYEKDGQKRTAAEVVADNVEFCGSKNNSPSEPVNRTEFTEVDDDGGLPF